MDDGIGDWNEIIEGGLAMDVPGRLDSNLVGRIESRLAREGSGPKVTGGRPGLLLTPLGVWLVLATGLILLHVQVSPATYESLVTAVRSVADGARLDLIFTSGAVLLLAEAVAHLRE